MAEYNAGTVVAKMKADGSGYSSTIDSVKRKDRELISSARGVEQAYREMGISAGIALAALTTGVFKATEAHIGLNRAMADVGTLIPGNIDKLQQYRKAVQGMSIDINKGTDDLAGGLYELISAFGDTDDTLQKLEINAKAANAGRAQTVDSIRLTSAVTKAYGDISAQATERVADLAFMTLKLGQTSFPALAQSLGDVVPMASQLGMEIDEMMNIFATLTGVTGDTGKVATQAAAMLRAFVKPTTEMSNAIKKLGFESASALLSEMGLVGALKEVIRQTDGTEESIAKLFGRAEALTAVFSLTGAQADIFSEKLDKMRESSGALDDAFREQIEGINKLGVAKDKTALLSKQLAEIYGESLEPTTIKVYNGFNLLLEMANKYIETNPGLVAGATAGAIAFAGLTTAMGATSFMIPKLIAGFNALFISSGPIGWGILAVSALTTAVIALKTAQEAQLRQMKQLGDEYRKQSKELYALVAEHRELSEKTEKTATEKERLKDITEKIIKITPEAIAGYNDEGEAILDVNIALQEMVDKKKEALSLDRELLERRIKDEEWALHELERKRQDLLAEMENYKSLMQGHAFSDDTINQTMRAYLDEINNVLSKIEDRQQVINALTEDKLQLDTAISNTTVEMLSAEYEKQRVEEANRRLAIEDEKRKEEERKRQEDIASERMRLEAEIAGKIRKLTTTETEQKLHELEEQYQAYKDKSIDRILVDEKEFSLDQWRELERTKILEEETEKRKQLELELISLKDKARIQGLEGLEKQLEQYEADRQMALRVAEDKFAGQEQLQEALIAINQYYDSLALLAQKEHNAEIKEEEEQLIAELESLREKARLSSLDGLERQKEQYALDRANELKEARAKYENKAQLRVAEQAINTYYDNLENQAQEAHNAVILDRQAQLHADYLLAIEEFEESALLREFQRWEKVLAGENLTAEEIEKATVIHEKNVLNIKKDYTQKRIDSQKEAIEEQYKLQQRLTQWEREELLKRLQAELEALELTTNASEERMGALRLVIDDLKKDLPNVTKMTREWTETLVDNLARAIAHGESLGDVFTNLLRMVAEYMIKQALIKGISTIGMPFFHDGGVVPPRYHFGGTVSSYLGAMQSMSMGLRNDEVPIIAQTGERVLSREQNRAYEAGFKPEVNIEVINNTGTQIETRREVEHDGARTVVRLFMDGYSRNIDGIQNIMKKR